MPMATGRPKMYLPADPYAETPRIDGGDRSSQDEYEADCLAGRRFPNPGDTEMEQRCREHHRIREWFELFRRFHMSTLSRNTHYESCIRNYFVPFFDVKPRAISRQAVQQWFIQIGQKSHVTANHSIGLFRTLFNKMSQWGVYDGSNPTEGIKRYRLPIAHPVCSTGGDAADFGVYAGRTGRSPSSVSPVSSSAVGLAKPCA